MSAAAYTTAPFGAPDVERPTLCFVVTYAFHGATLLSLLLNNHSRISALGDTNPSREFDQGCPCGEHVSTCPFWQTVAGRTRADRFARLDTMLPLLPWPLENNRLEGRAVPLSRLPALNRILGRAAARAFDVALPVLWRSGHRPVESYVDVWRSFYATVRELHGTTLVVDGMKSSRKAALLARELGGEFDVRVIHLVRDPRGFVNSWWRHHGRSDDARTLAWRWTDVHSRNEQLASVAPYRLVRYSDLAADPEGVIGSLLEFLGVPGERVVDSPRYAHKHHLIGNNMLVSFDGVVNPDERWRAELTSEEQQTILRVAGTSAERYGCV